MRLFELQQPSVEEIHNRLKTECQPFYNEWVTIQEVDDPKCLWRVMGDKNRNWDGSSWGDDEFLPLKNIFNKIGKRKTQEIWTDRHCPGATKLLHNLMKKDGFVATRLNSVFCYPHFLKGMTRRLSFGSTYAIFPIGPFVGVHHNAKKLENDLGDARWLKIVYGKKDQIASAVEEFWYNNKENFYQTSSAKELIITPNSEVMLKCNKYHAVPEKLINGVVKLALGA